MDAGKNRPEEMMEVRDYLANRTPVPSGTLTKLLFDSVDRFGARIAFRAILSPERFGSISFTRFLELTREVVLGLRRLGLTRGDRIAILSENRPEWSQVDFGAACLGVPLVPIHTTLTSSQIAYILRDSGAVVLFVSTDEMLLKAQDALEELDRAVDLVLFDEIPDGPQGSLAWREFRSLGVEALGTESLEAFWEEALRARPEDTATILYTSGTTGEPKGVVLSHNNFCSNVAAVSSTIPFRQEDSTLSFLPLSHVLQRTGDYLFFSHGMTITYARSLRSVAEDLVIARPTKVIAPPRFYEKAHAKIMEQRGLKGFLVRWATEVGEAWTDETLAGRKPTWILRLVYRLAQVLVFARIKEALGGRIDFFISGSAALAPEINKFFFAAGVRILEGYGLSETSPVVTANTPEAYRIGSVGVPVPATEIRIAEDGEILVRGPQVMGGYFNRPEDTAAALTKDGWLRTGDIGEIDEDGFLWITDRKKNILVTAGGKNIAPGPIENQVRGSRYVDQAVMIGDGRNFPALLVVPSFEALEPWARSTGIHAEDRAALLRNTRVQEMMKAEVFGSLGPLASFETPKKVGLIQEEFTIEGGILTPNLKVKRRVVRERYGDLIREFYDPANRDRWVFVNGE